MRPIRSSPGGPRSTRQQCGRSATSGDEDAVYVVVGAKDGYVGRDGQIPEGETSRFGPARPPEGHGATGLKAHTVYKTFNTSERRQFVRITDDVQAAVDESGIAEGMALVSAMHITAGVWVNDDEPGIQADALEWLDKLAPPCWRPPANEVAELCSGPRRLPPPPRR